MQKLLYYAQGWHLALEGSPLFTDNVEAWAHGPVCKEVYHAYKSYGWDSVPFTTPAAKLTDVTKTFIAKIWNAYGQYSGKALEEMTHAESPWKDHFDGTKNKVIPLEEIQKYFKQR